MNEKSEEKVHTHTFICTLWENHLQINVTKTRDMVVDFRRNKPLLSPVCISGTDVD